MARYYIDLDKDLLKEYVDYMTRDNGEKRVLKSMISCLDEYDTGEVTLFVNTMIDLGHFENSQDLDAFSEDLESCDLIFNDDIHTFFMEVAESDKWPSRTDIVIEYAQACLNTMGDNVRRKRELLEELWNVDSPYIKYMEGEWGETARYGYAEFESQNIPDAQILDRIDDMDIYEGAYQIIPYLDDDETFKVIEDGSDAYRLLEDMDMTDEVFIDEPKTVRLINEYYVASLD